MNIWSLAVLTIAALTFAIVASFKVMRIKMRYKKSLTNNAFLGLAAEDLLGVIAGVPLAEFIAPGDNIEIVIKTNGQPIAGSHYRAKSLDGNLKLTAINEA